MKKNGKKYRNLKKQQEERRKEAMLTQKPPFSRHRVLICNHVHMSHYSFLRDYYLLHMYLKRGMYSSCLQKKSDTECYCSVCKTVFPIEVKETIDTLLQNLANSNCNNSYRHNISFSEIASPVKYYRTSETDIEYVTDKSK